MVDTVVDLLDYCRQGWHFSVAIFIVPILIILSPAIPRIDAVHHFTFHRMQHYEFAGNVRGSPGVALNCEVRTLSSAAVARKCLVVSWKEFIAGDIATVVQKGIIALIVALPNNLSSVVGEDRDAFFDAEQAILRLDLQIPVYFVEQTPEVTEWLESLSFHAGRISRPQTATEELLQQVTGDYYYISSNLYSAKTISDVKISNMIGKLGESGETGEPQKAIILVAHLDSAGVAPGLSYGANSDASGVAALLEVVRIITKLLRTQKSAPKTEIFVILSSGGKFNFFGTKKWLDEQSDAVDTGLLSRIQYGICLDGIGREFPPSVYVSRPPRENSPAYRALEMINGSSVRRFGDNIALIHKKINLAEDELAWEHEQFSLAKVPAFTISGSSSTKTSSRKSILDTSDDINITAIAKTAFLVAETLAAEMYDLRSSTTDMLHKQYLVVSEENIASWMRLLTQQPRSLQSLTNDHPVVSAVKDYLGKQLTDFKVKPLGGDKGESDIVLHGPITVTVTASRTKQPFFDLLVTVVIALYGGLVYALLQYVDVLRIIQSWLKPVVNSSAIRLRTVKSMKYQ